MTVYRRFTEFVEENADFVTSFPGLVGEKVIYRYKDYFITLDLHPVAEEDRVVSVMKDGKAVYLSKSFFKGVEMVMGIKIYEFLSKPEILEELLEEWERRYNGK